MLAEQRDWFEDEIHFVLRRIKPGRQVIDIGANYGVYSLCMARAVTETGRVWAFEPCSATAALLAASIEANGFSQVTLVQAAVSDRTGEARLQLGPHCELHALQRDPLAAEETASETASETVATLTLDQCLDSQHWASIDFIKIDAEGEDRNILRGGGRFFRELSPLVQYEVKQGEILNLDMVGDLAALGYDSYRLVPGLNVLTRFDPNRAPDSYLLNLFACRADRAARLAAEGLLVDPGACPEAEALERLLPPRSGSGDGPVPAELESALALHALSRDGSRTAAIRATALAACLERLERLCREQPSPARLASLARVAREQGQRQLAVAVLQQLALELINGATPDPAEPCLPPCERFETIAAGAKRTEWLLAATLEALEQLQAYSSFYTGPAAWERLDLIRWLGYGSEEMGRRLELVRRRCSPEATPQGIGS